MITHSSHNFSLSATPLMLRHTLVYPPHNEGTLAHFVRPSVRPSVQLCPKISGSLEEVFGMYHLLSNRKKRAYQIFCGIGSTYTMGYCPSYALFMEDTIYSTWWMIFSEIDTDILVFPSIDGRCRWQIRVAKFPCSHIGKGLKKNTGAWQQNRILHKYSR